MLNGAPTKLRKAHAITATVRMKRSSEPTPSRRLVLFAEPAVERLRRNGRGVIARFFLPEASPSRRGGKRRGAHYVRRRCLHHPSNGLMNGLAPRPTGPPDRAFQV